MADTLRLAFVADIHHGEDHFTKKGSAAAGLMAEFARFVADARPDAVVDLGDRISDRDHETDLVLEAEVAEMFRAVRGPVHHICGNHDRDFLSVADNERILGAALGHQTIDIAGKRLVIWRADTLIRRPGGFVLAEADLLWLAAVVRGADRPLVIASHVPISGHSQTGNYYFEKNPDSSTYPGSGAVRARAVLREARVPVVWISGHVHWNTLTMVDGIPHLTLQSLTETFTTHPEPAGSHGLLEIGDRIRWTVFGRDTFQVDLALAEAGRRWVTPLPVFTEHPEIQARHLAQQVAGEAAR